MPVTRTLIVSYRSAETSLYVFAVAYEIATPDRYHWYFRVTVAGPQVPELAVSV